MELTSLNLALIEGINLVAKNNFVKTNFLTGKHIYVLIIKAIDIT